MITRDTFDVWTLVASWFSAIGTVAAVVTALWLARRQNRPAIRVTSGIYRVVQDGQAVGEGQTFFRIGVVNVGLRDVVLQVLCWRVGVFKRKAFVQLPAVHPYSATLPRRLASGDGADFMFPLDFYKKAAEPLRNAVSGRWKLFKRLRIGVVLTTGEEFTAPPDVDALRELEF